MLWLAEALAGSLRLLCLFAAGNLVMLGLSVCPPSLPLGHPLHNYSLACAPAQLWLLPALLLLETHGRSSTLVCPLHRLGTFSVSGDRLLQAPQRLSSHSKTPAGQGPAYATSDLQNHLFTSSIHGLHRPLCPAVREKRTLHYFAWHRIASGSISVFPSYKFCDAVTIPLSLFFWCPHCPLECRGVHNQF